MKDKEKQIEEMAKVIIQTSCNGKECENCSWIRSVEEATECCVCLKALYCAGYRKIPEGAVVLSREEYEKLKTIEKNYEDMAKGYYPIAQICDELKRQASKETAEKILERGKYCMPSGLREWIVMQYGVEVDND